MPYSQFPYFVCTFAISFHFHISGQRSDNLSVILQNGEDERKLLWSRSSSSPTQWVPKLLPLGKHDRPFRVCRNKCTVYWTPSIYTLYKFALYLVLILYRMFSFISRFIQGCFGMTIFMFSCVISDHL